MIKNNHVAAAGWVTAAARAVREPAPWVTVQVGEAVERVGEAVDGGADFLLLDNTTPDPRAV